MTSNILAGERRWASARRTGMTVLGKVAVPKPLNLPSQRLENHGLDPTVEIVPKGGLGWGGRPSSSASNPWGPSSQSPNADGGGSSPSHLSGRPSSGGTGSRPSTSGSERTHERSGNAWGLSSRPSSASGTSASNQTALPTSLRPHSAETRPGSSQLSRFAEPVSDNSGATRIVGNPERMGVVASENEKFSLTTGDFPTLNSNRDCSVKNYDSKDQDSCSRPGSASGRIAQKKEIAETCQDARNETVNTCWRDGHPSADDGAQPSMEKWHGEPHQYMNANIPPRQFDAWHSPSMNAPPGVWYRGSPVGPPYGAHIPPGGFHVEPFPYYCPQIPPPALANSQQVRLPGPGPGPRTQRPKNGDLYRPQMPDAFVCPGIQFRPGFYPNQVPFENYYRPPMGYCNSNEREVPFEGTPAGSSVYNRYPTPNAPDIGGSNARASKSGSTGKVLSEQVEPAHVDDIPARYKVLLKPSSDEKQQAEDQEIVRTSNSAHSRGGRSGTPLRRNEWGVDHGGEEEIYSTTARGGKSLSCTSDEQGGNIQTTGKIKSSESFGDKGVKESRTKQFEMTPSRGMSQAFSAGESGLVTARDSTLIQKIEVLNEKVRPPDVRNDGRQMSKCEEQKSSFQDADSQAGNTTSKAGNNTAWTGRFPVSGSTDAVTQENSVSIQDKPPLLVASRRSYDGVRGRSDLNSKRRINNSDGDEWQKKAVVVTDAASASHLHENRTDVAAVENHSTKNEGESLNQMLDSTDSLAQLSKKRELAKQRIIQRQKEDEERAREQKAKANAKLEELNRRTQGGSFSNLSTEKEKNVLPGVSRQEQEGSQLLVESGMLVGETQTLVPSLVSTADVVTKVSEMAGDWGDEVAHSASYSPLDESSAATLDPIISHGGSTLNQEMVNTGIPDCKAAPLKNDTGISRHKRNSYKPKQTTQRTDKTENLVPVDSTKTSMDYRAVTADETCVVAPNEVISSSELRMQGIPAIVTESPAHQRRKSNRGGKNKHKLDDVPSMPNSISPLPNGSSFLEVSTENEMCRTVMEFGSIPAAISFFDGTDFSEQHSYIPSEGAQGRLSNQLKPQQSRRPARNQQSNNFMDKYHGSDGVMWAPVRTMSRGDSETETSQKTLQESVSIENADNRVQSNLKSKRAEMERYVPKAVAKELAQQGSGQPLPSGLLTSHETAESVEPDLISSGVQPGDSLASLSVVPTLDSLEGDLKHNKQLKAHGAWRQRGPVQSRHVKGLQSGSAFSTSHTSRNIEVSMGQNEAVKHELNSAKAEGNSCKVFTTSDGGSVLKDVDPAAPIVSPHGRDLGIVTKPKRQAVKGDRRMGNHHAQEKNLQGREAERSHVHVGDHGTNQTEKIASKENRVFEGSSHWQPKSHTTSNNSQRGSKTGAQSDPGEVGAFVKKDPPSQPQAHVPRRHVKDSNEVNCSQPDQSGSGSKKTLEMVSVEHRGQKKERRGRPYSPNERSFGVDELTHVVMTDTHNNQQFSSDIRRNRNQNSRPTAGREARPDWNQERQRQNTHYEYQPVGPYNSSKAEKFEDGSQNMGPRYKERGQNHSKRGGGNLHGRQSGNVRIDAASG